jgi:hypothetical protein
MNKTEPEAGNPRAEFPRFQFRRWLLLLFVTICTCTLSGVTYFVWRTNVEKSCRTHLKYFSDGMLGAVIATGHLPLAYVMDSNGRRMHSWRSFTYMDVDLHEHSGNPDRYKFNEPWDGPENTRFRNETGYFEYYSCPFCANGSRNATYLCVVGAALWPVPQKRHDDWNLPLSFYRKEGGVLPSRGKAILLVEAVESDIPWTKPEDISLSELASLLREDPGGAQFCRRVRHVVAVDAARTPFILDPNKDIEEIKTLVESETAMAAKLP